MIIAGESIRAWVTNGASTRRWYIVASGEAWQDTASINVVTRNTISLKPDWARITKEACVRSHGVVAGHTCKAWSVGAAVRVGAHHTITTAARLARARMLTRPIVIAISILIAVVFVCHAWEDLGA